MHHAIATGVAVMRGRSQDGDRRPPRGNLRRLTRAADHRHADQYCGTASLLEGIGRRVVEGHASNARRWRAPPPPVFASDGRQSAIDHNR